MNYKTEFKPFVEWLKANFKYSEIKMKDLRMLKTYWEATKK